MVRVIVKHKTSDSQKLVTVIRGLRNEAMRQPGFITGETLINTEDPSDVLVISTWQRAEDWDTWDKSETRRKMTEDINKLLVEPYTVEIYHYYLVRTERVWSTI